MSRRWIRLDVTCFESEWLVSLSPSAQHMWTRILLYVKATGHDGRAKVLGPAAVRRLWGIEEMDRGALLEAAHQHGAMQTEGGDWVIAAWEQYQKPDPTAAARKRKQRVTAGHGVTEHVTHGNGVTRHVTETLTLTETVKATSTAAVGSEKPKIEHTVASLALEANEVLGKRMWWRSELDPKYNETKAFIRRTWDGSAVALDSVYAAIHGLRIMVDRGDVEWLADRKGKPLDGIHVLIKQAVIPGPDGTQLRPIFSAAEEAYRNDRDTPRTARTNGLQRLAAVMPPEPSGGAVA